METIFVTNLKTGEFSEYKNCKGGGEAVLKVYRDSVTKKFHKFRIEFWLLIEE